MKIPVEWLKQYIKINKNSKDIAESFTLLGLMLDKPVINYKDGNYTTDVLDLEHRMDRSDWLSITGCARDIAAFEKIDFNYPELYTKKGKTPEKNQIVDIQVTCPDYVNRFNTRVFRNIKVTQSPAWLKNRLQAYGIPSINNIVDITNYVMVELGQPMHAQDLAKFTKQEIVIRKAKNGEQITTLLGETVTLDDGCFVLTQNDIPTVLGGIVGGQTTGITTDTTDIILDAGNYNQVTIRKASRRLKIQNETVLRYDKFLHPELTELAIQRATKLILELAGGTYYENIDWNPKQMEHKQFHLRMDRILTLGGMPFSKKAVKDILNRLNYNIVSETSDTFDVIVPYFRTDVEVEDDIVADVLRINSYKNIPSSMIDRTPPDEITPEIYKFENKVRNILVTIGAHEHITEPLLNGNKENADQIILENSQSEDKNGLRTNIYSTLQKVISVYEKNKMNEIVIFEIGKTYHRKNLEEVRETQVIVNMNTPIETANKTKVVLRTLLKELGISDYTVNKEAGIFKINASGKTIGSISYNTFNLINTELIGIATKNDRATTQNPYNQFEDISIILPIENEVGEIYKAITTLDTSLGQITTLVTKMDDTKKNVVFRLFYSGDFSGIKTKIIEKIKSFPNVEVRS